MTRLLVKESAKDSGHYPHKLHYVPFEGGTSAFATLPRPHRPKDRTDAIAD